MPISKKIKAQINSTNETPEMKKLMMDILNLENNGVGQWRKGYFKLVDNFILDFRSNSGEVKK